MLQRGLSFVCAIYPNGGARHPSLTMTVLGHASRLALALVHTKPKDLVVDVRSSIGSGGRPMLAYAWDLYDWNVADESDAPSLELEIVPEEGETGVLVLPSSVRFSEGEVTWFFNVTATNWLGSVGWNTFQVCRACFYDLYYCVITESPQVVVDLVW